jgi:hypothetical protein
MRAGIGKIGKTVEIDKVAEPTGKKQVLAGNEEGFPCLILTITADRRPYSRDSPRLPDIPILRLRSCG